MGKQRKPFIAAAKSPPPPTAKPQRKTIAFAAALFALVFISFSPVLSNDFVNFDDAAYLTTNTHVQSGLTSENVRWAFTTTTASNWHPLTWISHMLDCQIYGMRPWGHHLTSLLLHALSSALLFYLLNAITGSLWRSLIVAGLFGLHPLRVESVAWAAERKDVLSMLFFLLTLFAYRKYTTATSRSHRIQTYLLALILYTLGLMSKPMLVSLPVLLFLIDFWPLARFQTNPFKTLVIEKLPFAGLALVFCAVTIMAQQASTQMVEQLTTAGRLENAFVSYARYVWKTIWPIHLAVFYPHPGSWPVAITLLSLLLVGCITAIALYLHKRCSAFTIGWLWFLVALVPTIGLIQVGRQSIADRYTYIPSIGFFIGLVWLATSVLAKSSLSHPAKLILAAVPILLCSGLTYRQSGFWKNGVTLFNHAIAVTDKNYLAHCNLGTALNARGDTEGAIREYQIALRLLPGDVNTRNSLGSFFLEHNRPDEAIEQFRIAIQYAPNFAEAHNNLGYALLKRGDLAAAIRELEAALKLNPKDYRVHVNLASAALASGQAAQAIDELKSAVVLEPGDIITRFSLGNLLFNVGRIDEAIEQFEAVLKLSSTNAEVHTNLGIALARKGRNDEAIAHFKEVLRLKPNDPGAEAQLRALTVPR